MLQSIVGLILAMAFGYLVGSIPFSLFVAKVFGIGDIRSMGSKNVGATNVLRNSNLSLGLLALSLDLIKGIIAVKVCSIVNITHNFATEAGGAAVLGHVFPVWLNFSGGKGVATLLGVLFASHSHLAFAFTASWLIVFYLFNYASLASIVALLSVGLTSILASTLSVAVEVITMSAFVLFKHRDNMTRFINGEERPLVLFKTKTPSQNGM